MTRNTPKWEILYFTDEILFKQTVIEIILRGEAICIMYSGLASSMRSDREITVYLHYKKIWRELVSSGEFIIIKKNISKKWLKLLNK